MTEQSLYERIGGVNAISMVVDRFIDQIVRNPKRRVNHALALPVAGGPFEYTGKQLGEPTRISI